MSPAVRCLLAGALCAVAAAALTVLCAGTIFDKQLGRAENQILSFEVLRPELKLEIQP
ncbi:MAG TPA: hypothetical protein VIS74_05555 [Chthoniobacterales bacterium]